MKGADTFKALLDDVIPILVHNALNDMSIQFIHNPNLQEWTRYQ